MVGGVPNDFYDPSVAPSEGNHHTYNVELDKSIGAWEFHVDASLWDCWTNSFWENKTFGKVVWHCEIRNKEDDMQGTESNPCNFTSCAYWKEGVGAKLANFVDPSSYDTSDPCEWAWEHVNSSAFNIWDIDPL